MTQIDVSDTITVTLPANPRAGEVISFGGPLSTSQVYHVAVPRTQTLGISSISAKRRPSGGCVEMKVMGGGWHIKCLLVKRKVKKGKSRGGFVPLSSFSKCSSKKLPATYRELRSKTLNKNFIINT